MLPIVSTLVGVGASLIDKLIPDKEAAAAAKIKLLELEQAGELEELKQRGGIVKAEAESQHWLTAAWRPITMLSFVAIVVNNYILAPYIALFFGADISLEIPPNLWDLLQIGIGGYIVGRSGEQIAKALKK